VKQLFGRTMVPPDYVHSIAPRPGAANRGGTWEAPQLGAALGRRRSRVAGLPRLRRGHFAYLTAVATIKDLSRRCVAVGALLY
jgi:hypothetical protein